MRLPREDRAADGTPAVRLALLDLKLAVQQLLTAVPGLGGFRPVDVQGALGIHLKLAWKLSHLAHAGDPFDAVRHLPGELAGSIVSNAARQRGVPEDRIIAVARALNQVQELGIAWAGSKRAFGLLSANLASNADGRFAVERRKELFNGGMHVWGMRAQTSFRVDILHPAAKGSSVDCLTVRGFVELERLRHDATWLLDGPAVYNDHGTMSARSTIMPPSGVEGTKAPFLVPELCSEHLPTLDRVPGTQTLQLAPGEVGRASAGTIVHAAVVENSQPRRRTKDYSGFFQVFRLRTPCESQRFIVAIHQSLIPTGVQPEAVMYSDLHGAPERRVPYHLGDRLDISTEVDVLPSRSKVRVPGVPNLDSWIKSQLSNLGWARGELIWFELTVSFPPIPTSLVMQMPQAE
jgi:hypothetical protein